MSASKKKTGSQSKKLSSKEMSEVKGGANVKMSAFDQQAPHMSEKLGVTIKSPGVTVKSGVNFSKR